MIILSKEQLEKLPTHRLLAYKAKLHKTLFEPSDWCWDCSCWSCKDTIATIEGRYQQIEIVKAVLNSREHVPRKSEKPRVSGKKDRVKRK